VTDRKDCARGEKAKVGEQKKKVGKVPTWGGSREANKTSVGICRGKTLLKARESVEGCDVEREMRKNIICQKGKDIGKKVA